MTVRLWHVDVGLPTYVRHPTGSVRLQYSKHARDRAASKSFKLPIVLPWSVVRLVEVETVGTVTSKYVVRGPYDALRDIVLVVQPDGFVRTAWLNDKADVHATLDRTKYDDPKDA